MSTADIIPFKTLSNHYQSDVCTHCSVKGFCLPVSLSESHAKILEDKLNKETRLLHKNEILFKPGDPFNDLYVVRSGSFKTLQSNLDFDNQIISFNFPGEMLGFDALHHEKHQLTTISLETSSVCKISFKELFLLAAEIPAIQKRLLTLATLEQAKKLSFSLNSTALVRVCCFLLNLSEGFKRRKLSPVRFHLSMSRHDIANYLGLTVETTSRMFSKLQEYAVIKFDRREVHILNLRKLQTLAINKDKE